MDDHAQPIEALNPPSAGQLVDIKPGVRWLRMPLPFKLDHINVWILEDVDGWALVDTGIRSDETAALWDQLMSTPQLQSRLTRVLVTHMHPDHIGMAGWLTRKSDVRLWISSLEYMACRMLVSDSHREAPVDALRFYRSAGWSQPALDAYRARFGNFGKFIHALPDSYVRLRDGMRVPIGEYTWEVVIGSGHSPEHACLYCPELKLFISGDQVLPRISSNVSVYPIEPEANPMADWYASLERIQRRVPDDVLVLPSHHNCFYGLHARIDALRRGQDESMNKLRVALGEPKKVVDLFTTLFRRPVSELDVTMLGMATGEAFACLNYLINLGEVVKEVDLDVAWYRLR